MSHLTLIIISPFPGYKSLLHLRIFLNILPQTVAVETKFLTHTKDR
jgi:hypothetical protein